MGQAGWPRIAGDGVRRIVFARPGQVKLGRYRGLLRIKSGSTSAAGYSFLFAARRDGRTLVGAVLNSSLTDRRTRFRDAARMLDRGFAAGRGACTESGAPGRDRSLI